MYIGHTSPNGWNGMLPPRLHAVKIYDNIVDNTGWDGIQLSNAREDAEIYNNYVSNYGTDNDNYQRAGIILGGNTQGDVYNNTIRYGTGNGIEIFGYGECSVIDNILDRAGSIPGQDSMYFNDNAITVETNPGLELTVEDNYIIEPIAYAIRNNDGNNTTVAGSLSNNIIYESTGKTLGQLVVSNASDTITGNVRNPEGGTDVITPEISITSPVSTSSYATGSSTITLSGSASDNVGVSQIFWSNSRGGSGSTAGTSTWTFSNIALYGGSNFFTVTATDAAGHFKMDTLIVDYTPPGSGAGAFAGVKVFAQDFASSTSLGDYIDSSSPDSTQLNDISAEANGGTWSVDSGKLKLIRTGASGSSNGAGFTRHTDLSGEDSIVRLSFEFSLNNLNTYTDLALLTVGDVDAFQDYNATTYGSHSTAEVIVKGHGNNLYRFVVNGVHDYTTFASDGSPVLVELYLNSAGATETYIGPDGLAYTLNDLSASLWVDSQLILDNVVRKAGFSGNGVSNFRMRVASTQAFTMTFDDFELKDIIDVPPSLLTQDFSSSTVVSSYVDATSPGSHKLNDISAETDGGTWSIYSGRLELVRSGATGSNNGAGFTRHTNLTVNDSLVMFHFDLSLDNINTYTEMGVMTVGDLNNVQDYNQTTYGSNSTSELSFKGDGSDDFRFIMNGAADYTLFPADGMDIHVVWIINSSGSTQSYIGPDYQRHSIEDSYSTLWVEEQLILNNIPPKSGFGGSGATDFRFRTGTSQPMTFTFDNFSLVDFE